MGLDRETRAFGWMAARTSCGPPALRLETNGLTAYAPQLAAIRGLANLFGC